MKYFKVIPRNDSYIITIGNIIVKEFDSEEECHLWLNDIGKNPDSLVEVIASCIEVYLRNVKQINPNEL